MNLKFKKLMLSLICASMVSVSAYADEHNHENHESHDEHESSSLTASVAEATPVATTGAITKTQKVQTTQKSGANIGKIMKQMKKSYRATSDSKDLLNFTKNFTEFKLQVAEVAKVPYKASQQAVYMEGLKALVTQFAPVDAAIKAKNLSLAKAEFNKMKETQKKYHFKLDV